MLLQTRLAAHIIAAILDARQSERMTLPLLALWKFTIVNGSG
jgi:hypothetical protein